MSGNMKMYIHYDFHVFSARSIDDELLAHSFYFGDRVTEKKLYDKEAWFNQHENKYQIGAQNRLD